MGTSILLAPPRTVELTVRERLVTVRELTIAELPELAEIFDEFRMLLAQNLPGVEIVRSLGDKMIAQIAAGSVGATEEFLRTLTPSELLGILEQIWSLNQLGNLIGRKLTEVLSPSAPG